MVVNKISLNSFNSNHKLYDKVRPDFVVQAVTALVNGCQLKAGSKVVELASGTGKFTKSIADKGYDIIAVEPSEGMNDSFKKNFPQIPLLEGSSYSIPLPDKQADAVLIAQAYHWFADHKSLEEINRVLKPTGYLGLIWNYDDIENLPENNWQRRITSRVWSLDGGVPQYRHKKWQNSFENQTFFKTPYNEEHFRFTKKIPASAEYIWNYWLSRSYITKLSEEEKEALRKDIFEIYKESVKDTDLIDGQWIESHVGTHIVWAQAN